ncbi:hypothetical protein SAMN04488062_12018 [Flavobacterium omnivorum]|uniref:Calcineurin-like phosphoesterase n=1 Tax=Flavobacterium omnivorum TaxID=178355 RepID=A0A1G8H3S2_9FLAO|nr:hypothetical protein [Flavobacterium omnivorum]SDI01294.1 hypothetical protein SAMN04488062_12018 [Flavobacterium omnivorum]
MENNIKIQYCSDLHLEFLDNRKWVLENPIIPKGDILILAGDIVLFREIHQHQKFPALRSLQNSVFLYKDSFIYI